MHTIGNDPLEALRAATAPPVQTDHDLLLALNEQVYELRKELQSLHRLMAAMKKTLRQAVPAAQPPGPLTHTEISMTMSNASYHDPLFELETDSMSA